METIKDGARRIKLIVKDLRVFSQLDAADKKVVNINDCLRASVNLVQTNYIKVASFITKFEDDAALLCYPAQLNQVFMNIIVNACDAVSCRHSQSSDKVLGRIVISCHRVEQSIEITVKDNGCGMTERTKNSLFEPFYTTKPVGEGTGLGLSIAYGIVQKHGGRLTVESQLDRGSVFKLNLPM
jgi:signal transduction histidine kinase